MALRRGYPGLEGNGRLPPDGGPSIREFTPAHSQIEWIKRLDDLDREDSEAFIYHVKIASRDYALKVFKFSNPKSNPFYWGTKLQKELVFEKAVFYTDPFYAECRAYGRIESGKVDENSQRTTPRVRQEIAVKCHGYLLLPDRDKRWLLRQGLDLDFDLIDHDVRKALGGDTRVRAIVKHLDTRPGLLHAGNIRRAWTSVRLLNENLKIYNMDIKADNFIGFRLVDFGSSWTEPHALLKYLKDNRATIAKGKIGRDAQNFDDMIEDEDISTRLRVVPHSRRQLRSRERDEEGGPGT